MGMLGSFIVSITNKSLRIKLQRSFILSLVIFSQYLLWKQAKQSISPCEKLYRWTRNTENLQNLWNSSFIAPYKKEHYLEWWYKVQDILQGENRIETSLLSSDNPWKWNRRRPANVIRRANTTAMLGVCLMKCLPVLLRSWSVVCDLNLLLIGDISWWTRWHFMRLWRRCDDENAAFHTQIHHRGWCWN